jgi:hypothetical protein
MGKATAPPFRCGRWRHHMVFILNHNKSFKDTIFLKCIGPEIVMWEYLNLGSTYRHFRIWGGPKPVPTSANTIYNGFGHKNFRFGRIFLQKHVKNHLGRGSGSRPNPRTSRPRTETSGCTHGRHIITSLYPNSHSLSAETAKKQGMEHIKKKSPDVNVLSKR